MITIIVFLQLCNALRPRLRRRILESFNRK